MPFKKGTRWLADWRDHRGIRKRRSFPTRGEASAFERQIHEAIQKKRPITAEDVFTPISHAAHARRDGDGYRMARDLAKKFRATPADQITAQDIIDLQRSWHEAQPPAPSIARHYSQATIRQFAQALRRVLREAAPTCPHLATLASKIKREKLPAVRDVTASAAEIDLALDHAHDGLALAVLLAYDSGLRISEACRVSPAGTNLDTSTITFTQKGGAIRITQITDRTAKLIHRCDPADPEPFVTQLWPKGKRQTTEPVHKQTCDTAWRALKKKLRMRPELHLHDLRRTLATNCLDQTGDLRKVQALLGHQSIATTARYIAPRIGENHKDLLELLSATSRWRPKQENP